MDGNLPLTKPKLRVAGWKGVGGGWREGAALQDAFPFHPSNSNPPSSPEFGSAQDGSLALGFHRKLNQLPSLITNPRFLIKGSLIKGRAQLCQCSDPAQGGLGASEEPMLVLLREGEMDRLPAAGWGGGVVLQDSRCDAGMVSPCRGSMSPGPAGKTLESPDHLTEERRPPRASGSSRLQGNLNAGPRAPGGRVWPRFLRWPRLLGLTGTHIQPGPLCLQLPAEPQAGAPFTHSPSHAHLGSSCPPGPEPSILAISRSKVLAWPELSCAHRRSVSESGRWVPAPRGLRPPSAPAQALNSTEGAGRGGCLGGRGPAGQA